MHTNEPHQSTQCTACGPGSLTVGLARATMTDERLIEVLLEMPFRPFHWYDNGEPVILLVNQADNSAAIVWTFDEAHALLHEIDDGPVAATLCLQPEWRGETIELSHDQLCSFAGAIEANLSAIIAASNC
jgi:hypothetical protein